MVHFNCTCETQFVFVTLLTAGQSRIINEFSSAGVSKLRPAGQMRPAKPFCQWWKN